MALLSMEQTAFSFASPAIMRLCGSRDVSCWMICVHPNRISYCSVRGRTSMPGKPGSPDILLVVEVADSSLEYDTTTKEAVLRDSGNPGVLDCRSVQRPPDRASRTHGDTYQTIQESGGAKRSPLNCCPAFKYPSDVLLP